MRRTSQLLVLPEASVLQAEPAPRGEAGHQGCAESDRSPRRPRPPHAARKKPALPAFSPLETNPDSGSLQTLRGGCGGRDSGIARKSWSPPLSPPLNFRINALTPHLLAKRCRLAGWLHSQGRRCPVHPLILAVQRGPEEAPWDRAVRSHCTWSPSCWALCGPSVGAETPGTSWLRAKLCMLTPRAGAETRAAEPGAGQSPRVLVRRPPSAL